MTRRGWLRAAASTALLFGCCLTTFAESQQTPDLPTLFIVGDSTARNNADGAQGWGDRLSPFFDSNKLQVVNRAMAGRSSRTFHTEGRWDAVLKEMKPGDYVLIQLGHNDGGPIDTGRARASLPGLGGDTREITKPDGTKETVHTYGWYITKMIREVRDKGATPVLLSLTVRNLWKEGRIERGSGRYKELIEALASGNSVPYVDVTSIIADRYEQMGVAEVKAMYGPDYVHTSPAGAALNAELVVSGIKANVALESLSKLLSGKGKSVSSYKARSQ